MEQPVVTRMHEGPPRRPRNLEERLFLRFPSLYPLLARFLDRLDPRSQLRRLLVRRAVIAGWAAVNRNDLELRRVLFAADVETVLAHDAEALGLSGLRGASETERALGELSEVWDWEIEPAYVLDFHDRLLILGFNRMHARASGVKLDQEFAQLATLRRGLVVRDEVWFQWADGLEAVGLEPHAFERAK